MSTVKIGQMVRVLETVRSGQRVGRIGEVVGLAEAGRMAAVQFHDSAIYYYLDELEIVVEPTVADIERAADSKLVAETAEAALEKALAARVMEWWEADGCPKVASAVGRHSVYQACWALHLVRKNADPVVELREAVAAVLPDLTLPPAGLLTQAQWEQQKARHRRLLAALAAMERKS